MKQIQLAVIQDHRASPPSRRRGLKLAAKQTCCKASLVASLAEAWIETCNWCCCRRWCRVASLAEAWIETSKPTFYRFVPRSPPSRRRGLKRHTLCPDRDILVASLAEAWIETKMGWLDRLPMESPPSRRRGLKLVFLEYVQLVECRLPRGGVD